MGTVIRSDGFRLTLSGVGVGSLVLGLVFLIRLDAKADGALKDFDSIRNDVSELRKEMAEDRKIISDHSAQIREHRVMINELQRRSAVGKEW